MSGSSYMQRRNVSWSGTNGKRRVTDYEDDDALTPRTNSSFLIVLDAEQVLISSGTIVVSTVLILL